MSNSADLDKELQEWRRRELNPEMDMTQRLKS